MTNLTIDGSCSHVLVAAELSRSLECSFSTNVRLIQLLSLGEAKQESCQRLEATVQLVGELAEGIGFELADWRLTPNCGRFDLLFELRWPEKDGVTLDLHL